MSEIDGNQQKASVFSVPVQGIKQIHTAARMWGTSKGGLRQSKRIIA